jgi:hypothetical protein
MPLADGYWTEDARRRNAAQARSAAGGVFMKMPATPALRDKWQRRASTGTRQQGPSRNSDASSAWPLPEKV